jgi:hypothetical protein
MPSFRIALAMEKAEWKPFRNALDKSERKEFDEMWDIPKLYVSACSNSVQLVPLHPIFISILFHHYKELLECKREVEELGAKVNAKGEEIKMKDIKYSTIKEEEEKDAEKMQEIRITTAALDGFLIENNEI